MAAAFGWAWILLAACAVAHLIVCRATRGAAFIRSGYIVWLVGAAAAAVAVWPRGWLFALGFYLFAVILWNLYTTFFINLTNSVSLRMMIEIGRSEGGTLSAEQIGRLYPDEQALESRIQAMARAGLIREEANELVLTGAGRRLAALTGMVRRIFGIDFFG